MAENGLPARVELPGRIVMLEPIAERHQEGLRGAAERDPQIHRFTNMYTLGFDLALAAEREVRCEVHLGVGGRFEGIFRRRLILPDSIRDSAWYAVLDEDWPQVRPLLEAKIERHLA